MKSLGVRSRLGRGCLLTFEILSRLTHGGCARLGQSGVDRLLLRGLFRPGRDGLPGGSDGSGLWRRNGRTRGNRRRSSRQRGLLQLLSPAGRFLCSPLKRHQPLFARLRSLGPGDRLVRLLLRSLRAAIRGVSLLGPLLHLLSSVRQVLLGIRERLRGDVRSLLRLDLGDVELPSQVFNLLLCPRRVALGVSRDDLELVLRPLGLLRDSLRSHSRRHLDSLGVLPRALSLNIVLNLQSIDRRDSFLLSKLSLSRRVGPRLDFHASLVEFHHQRLNPREMIGPFPHVFAVSILETRSERRGPLLRIPQRRLHRRPAALLWEFLLRGRRSLDQTGECRRHQVVHRVFIRRVGIDGTDDGLVHHISNRIGLIDSDVWLSGLLLGL